MYMGEVEGGFLYPRDGALMSGPWELFRLTSGPTPIPDLLGLKIPTQGSGCSESCFFDPGFGKMRAVTLASGSPLGLIHWICIY